MFLTYRGDIHSNLVMDIAYLESFRVFSEFREANAGLVPQVLHILSSFTDHPIIRSYTYILSYWECH
jgi:hypothetical protein